jgi:adenylate cyclase
VPLLEVRQHDVAILFADIVGFTALSESLPPVKVMEFLREFHRRMEEEVFRYGGTLDKYIGDAVMVSFGAPLRGAHDATNALCCARSMQQSIAEWNREKEISGEPFIRMGIGVHYGSAVMGDIGSERTSAFAVIGDTTNMTSRLQKLTRDLGVDVVVSQDVMDAFMRETMDTGKILEGFIDVGSQLIQGRKGAMHVWTLKAGSEVSLAN